MSNLAHVCVELPGNSIISSYCEDVQLSTLKWAQKFKLYPEFKPFAWYTKAQFGMQAAREYPYASYQQLCLAGDLLTWLFTVDDKCDRASSDKTQAMLMKELLHEFIAILEDIESPKNNKLSFALSEVLNRFVVISTPYLYWQLCNHIITYLKECFYELDMQLSGYIPSIAEYFAVRPDTGFSIMFPPVAIFQESMLPDYIYKHDLIQEIELQLNYVGGLSNDIHSFEREKNLETTGLNLVFIAQRELNLSIADAKQYVIDQHNDCLQRLEQCRNEMPFWSKEINRQVDLYVSGLYSIVKGYDDWAIYDTNRYAS